MESTRMPSLYASPIRCEHDLNMAASRADSRLWRWIIRAEEIPVISRIVGFVLDMFSPMPLGPISCEAFDDITLQTGIPSADKRAQDRAKRLAEIKNPGGVCELVARLRTAGIKGKIGLGVAGHNGNPTGLLAQHFSTAISPEGLRIRTQEEAVVANMARNLPQERLHKLFYEKCFQGKWGMKDGHNATTTETLQGVDFTQTKDAHDYYRSFVLKGAKVSALHFDAGGQIQDVNTERAHEVTAIFTSGPNVYKKEHATSCTDRTCNQKALQDYAFFKKCIKAALSSMIDAMIAENVDVALIPRLSTGVFAGPHQDQIRAEFANLVSQVLDSPAPYRPDIKKGQCFSTVLIPDVGPSSIPQGWDVTFPHVMGNLIP